jgi:hypothetical protein
MGSGLLSHADGGRGKKASSGCTRRNFDGNIGGILKFTLGSLHEGIISRSILKGLHMKDGGFVSTHHLLCNRKKNQGKTSSSLLVSGPSGSLPTFSQQPAIQIRQL